MDRLNLALVQMSSGPDWADNIRTVDELLGQCDPCDLAVLPENVLCLGRGETVHDAARPIDELDDELGALTARHGFHALFGGVPVLHDGQVRNAALAYSPDGSQVARYDKVHLFQLDPEAGGVDEAKVYVPGHNPMVWDFSGWRICQSICYDIRFPELYRACAPIDLILCPMAFLAHTGNAHGHTLLKARAIENLCYVATASQCGTNRETGREMFGHTLAVDPWGRVLADAGASSTGVTHVQCHKEQIHEYRSHLPVLRNRRPGGFNPV